MKFVSSMNMEHCATEQGIDRLYRSLVTFIKDHKVMDSAVFDDVSQKARNLGNRKLMDQCRVAKARCEETRQLLRVREATVYKAREELEAQRARLIPLEQLAADTDITPIRASSFSQPRSQEDVWVPINPTAPSSSSSLNSDISRRTDDTNNNSSVSPPSDGKPALNKSASKSSLSFVGKSYDTTTSSQEDIDTGESHESLSSQSDSKIVTPIQHQMESSLIKRRSFGGFKTQSSVSQAAKSKLHQQLKEKVTSDSRDDYAAVQSLVVLDDSAERRHSSVIERLEGFEESAKLQTDQSKTSSIRESIVTGSSGSISR